MASSGRIEVTDTGSGLYSVHPGFLDACSRVAAAALPANLSADSVYIPAGVRALRVVTATPQAAWSHAVLAAGDSSEIREADVSVYGLDGSLAIEIAVFGCSACAVQRLRRNRCGLSILQAPVDPVSKTASGRRG